MEVGLGRNGAAKPTMSTNSPLRSLVATLGHSGAQQAIIPYHSRPRKASTGNYRPFRTLPGHFRPFQALTGQSTPLQAITGHYGPLQAILGCFRPVQAIMGHSSPLTSGPIVHRWPVYGTPYHSGPMRCRAGHHTHSPRIGRQRLP